MVQLGHPNLRRRVSCEPNGPKISASQIKVVSQLDHLGSFASHVNIQIISVKKKQ
jgi:hypothetical protein